MGRVHVGHSYGWVHDLGVLMLRIKHVRRGGGDHRGLVAVHDLDLLIEEHLALHAVLAESQGEGAPDVGHILPVGEEGHGVEDGLVGRHREARARHGGGDHKGAGDGVPSVGEAVGEDRALHRPARAPRGRPEAAAAVVLRGEGLGIHGAVAAAGRLPEQLAAAVLPVPAVRGRRCARRKVGRHALTRLAPRSSDDKLVAVGKVALRVHFHRHALEGLRGRARAGGELDTSQEGRGAPAFHECHRLARGQRRRHRRELGGEQVRARQGRGGRSKARRHHSGDFGPYAEGIAGVWGEEDDVGREGVEGREGDLARRGEREAAGAAVRVHRDRGGVWRVLVGVGLARRARGARRRRGELRRSDA
mmetsp:Transcript_57018/g.180459  ORF Transcript_57018/g.180459 Transcript_57018/m.180459 type:complete len:362 (-) Transcript_57018:4436-5521(-)